jgi:hypothetical protein
MQAARYVLISALLGGLTVWGSENLFWTMPATDLTPLGLLLTVLAYSVASAVALSAVIWTGVGGLPAAFLGGAIVGYMSEGVIVGTIYQPVPPLFYLVWTPLAWHALITGGLIFGVGRAAAALGPLRLALIWTAFGLAGAYWAQYWVTERPELPDPLRIAVYILVLGLIVPFAHVAMDRMGRLPRPQPLVLWVAPVIAAAVWLLASIADPNPMRLVLPPILALILWVMWRLGQRDGPVSLGKAAPVWHHLLFLIAPALMVGLAPLGWAQGWGSLQANWVVAGLTMLGSVAWLARLVWSAAKRPQRR